MNEEGPRGSGRKQTIAATSQSGAAVLELAAISTASQTRLEDNCQAEAETPRGD